MLSKPRAPVPHSRLTIRWTALSCCRCKRLNGKHQRVIHPRSRHNMRTILHKNSRLQQNNKRVSTCLVCLYDQIRLSWDGSSYSDTQRRQQRPFRSTRISLYTPCPYAPGSGGWDGGGGKGIGMPCASRSTCENILRSPLSDEIVLRQRILMGVHSTP